MYFYLLYFTGSPFQQASYHWGTWFFLAGLLFSRFGVNDVGSHGYLAFFGKAVRHADGSYVKWGDGMYLIPTLFPPFNVIGVPLGWTMKHASTSEIPIRPVTPQEDNYVFLDHRLPRYNINSTVGYWQQTFARLTENFISWVFSYNPQSELRYQKIGSILMVIGLALGWFMQQRQGYFPQTEQVITYQSGEQSAAKAKMITNNNRQPQVVESAATMPRQQPPVINGYTVNLAVGQVPRYPSRADFMEVVKTSGVQYYYRDVDGLKYFWYVEGESEAPVTLPPSSCKIVPAGKEVRLSSSVPPRYVINMEESILYRVKSAYLPENERSLLFPNSSQLRKGTWGILRANWNTYDRQSDGILARTLPQGSLPSSQYGGLVCF